GLAARPRVQRGQLRTAVGTHLGLSPALLTRGRTSAVDAVSGQQSISRNGSRRGHTTIPGNARAAARRASLGSVPTPTRGCGSSAAITSAPSIALSTLGYSSTVPFAQT